MDKKSDRVKIGPKPDSAASYPKNLWKLRKAEFSQFHDSIYLDHAGSTAYSNSQITHYALDLKNNLYGNPHSANPSSDLMHDVVHQVRCTILSHFNTSLEDYDVVFASGATGAAKTLSSNFDWLSGYSRFAYLEDNHTSIVGIREVAAANNSSTLCLCLTERSDPFSLQSYSPTIVNASKQQESTASKSITLFAYAAQSNFSGCKYPLSWIDEVKNDGFPCITENNTSNCKNIKKTWAILLDAASFVATSPLDLNKYSPDFICISFYKMFGFPTGLGALLVKRSSSELLCNKKYFGGGTVNGYIARENYFKPREVLHDRLEDGTLPFLDIVALKHGFDFLYKAIDKSMINVQNYTFLLTQKLHTELCQLKHDNGFPVVEIYSYSNFDHASKQGPIIAFNVKRADESYVGFNHVLHLASSCNIHLRGGCFCNVGGCMSMIGVHSDILKNAYKSGHTCGGNLDLWNGQPLGAVRASLGYMSTEEDVRALVNFIKECFVNVTNDQEIGHDSTTPSAQLRLKGIYVYPIKSCRGMEVSEWPVCETGLKYDRSWMIVNEHGAALTLKREHKLALIQPFVDLKTQTLTIKTDGFPCLSIPVDVESLGASMTVDSRHTKVCGDRIVAQDCGEEASQWLSDFLGRTARLVYKPTDSHRKKRSKTETHSLALTNEAQYLLLSLSSVEHLRKMMVKSHQTTIDTKSVTSRFRCNFLTGGTEPFEEETWSEIAFHSEKSSKKVYFQCTGLCNRCSMICIDSQTGEKDIEPLRTLGSLPLPNDTEGRRRTTFGIYLKSSCINSLVSVGDVLIAQVSNDS